MTRAEEILHSLARLLRSDPHRRELAKLLHVAELFEAHQRLAMREPRPSNGLWLRIWAAEIELAASIIGALGWSPPLL